jgi:CubicO group peptidase (beta-lactamase class C family)
MTSNHHHSSARTLWVLTLGSAALLLACSNTDTDDRPAATPQTSTTPNAQPAPTSPRPTSSAATTPSPATSSASAQADHQADNQAEVDDLIMRIQRIIDQAIRTSALDEAWSNAQPTGVAIGVRAPGRDDILLASGTNVDGSPFEPGAPFDTATLTTSVVTTIAFQLIDEGQLDPAATIDHWLPRHTNSDRITIEMLLNGTHGWHGFGDIAQEAVFADPARSWTLHEALTLVEDLPADGKPGTFHDGGLDTAATALAYIIEQETGSTLADTVKDRIAAPIGLDHTSISDGAPRPVGFQEGVTWFGGPGDTSEHPHTAYTTLGTAFSSLTSTIPDILDLIGAWASGALFTADRTVAPERFLAERPMQNGPGTPPYGAIGLGLPINGYCPCQPSGAGLVVNAVGRAPVGVGTLIYALHYPATGVSVALHFNSGDYPDGRRFVTFGIVDAVHDVVQSALSR